MRIDIKATRFPSWKIPLVTWLLCAVFLIALTHVHTKGVVLAFQWTHCLKFLRPTLQDGYEQKCRRSCFRRHGGAAFETRCDAKKRKRFLQETPSKSDDSICLRFSHSWQRHIVYRPRRGRPSPIQNGTAIFCSPDDECDQVLASFLFLDEAQAEFPNAKHVFLPEACFDCGEPEIHRAIVAGGGVQETTAYQGGCVLSTQDIVGNRTQSAYDALMFLASLAWSCGTAPGTPTNSMEASRAREHIAAMLADRVGKRRFLIHTAESIRRNHQRLMDLLTRGDSMLFQPGLAMDDAGAREVIANFPQLCLYDFDEVEERVQFFVNPQPPSIKDDAAKKNRRRHVTELDWPHLACIGYGAGLTIEQATEAVRVVPQLLAIHQEDAAKPSSLLYFYQQLQISYELCDQARVQLDSYLTGAAPSDVWTFALLRSLDVEWHQMKILLDAFPALVICDCEPSWELLDHGPVRSVLKESDLHYLRKRLQINPSEVFAMIKTHSRLAGYSVANNIKPTLDAFQSRLGFSSKELRKVMLRMPSLIGMSVKDLDTGLNQRLDFFFHEVGMSPADLRKAVLRQPSLLQYSVESSLRPKLVFLRDELCVPSSSIGKLIAVAPSLMGLSLSSNLEPTAAAIMEKCGFSRTEMGSVISRVPGILTMSWKRNIEPTLLFLVKYLRLSKRQLRELVLSTPRVLIHSVESSIEPKLRMIQTAMEYEAGGGSKSPRSADDSKRLASTIVIGNPALLVTTNEILKRRLQTYTQDPETSLSDALQSRASRREQDGPTSRGPPRRKRCVLEVIPDSGQVVNEYPSVKVAATTVGSSVPNMYDACRKGRLLKGKKFVYGDKTAPSSSSTDALVWDKRNVAGGVAVIPEIPSTVRSSKNKGLVGAIQSSAYQVDGRTPVDDASGTTVSLQIFVSGRVYPPDNSDEVRGRRRAGGMALYFPQVFHHHHHGGGSSEFSLRLLQAATASFGQIMPGIEGGSNFTDGTILVGFPYLRPSGNRCGLYACHDALKVVLQLLKQEATTTTTRREEADNLKNVHFDIQVNTDSDYAWKLLQNETRVKKWGSYPTKNAFVYDGHGPSTLANPDLLYPLTRTFYKLVAQRENFTADGTTNGQPLIIGKSIHISFHHTSETLLERGLDQQAKALRRYAERAANWQYDRYSKSF